MKEYLLLFRGGDTERKQFSPQQIEAHMKRWTEWIGGIAQSGNLIGAQPLTSEGRVLTGTSKKLTDGPFIEGKEILGGYVLVKAENFDAYLYYSLLGEIHLKLNDVSTAKKMFEKAAVLTQSKTEQRLLQNKINALIRN